MKTALLLSLCAVAFGQQFEVAIVKIAQPGSNLSMIGGLRDGQFTARYDVVATAPANAKPADAPVMLRALLADRLAVVAHRETAERNVYALEVARGGAKLAPFDASKKPEFPPREPPWSDVLGSVEAVVVDSAVRIPKEN